MIYLSQPLVIARAIWTYLQDRGISKKPIIKLSTFNPFKHVPWACHCARAGTPKWTSQTQPLPSWASEDKQKLSKEREMKENSDDLLLIVRSAEIQSYGQRTSLAVQWLRLRSQFRGHRFVPGWRTKIPVPHGPHGVAKKKRQRIRSKIHHG